MGLVHAGGWDQGYAAGLMGAEIDLAILDIAGQDPRPGEEGAGGEIVAVAGQINEGQSDRGAGAKEDRLGREIKAPHLDRPGGRLSGDRGNESD